MKNTIWFAPLLEAVFDGCDQLLEDGEVLSGDLHGVESGPSNLTNLPLVRHLETRMSLMGRSLESADRRFAGASAYRLIAAWN